MDWPTFIAAIFAGVAALVNIVYTYYNTRKTNFINVITSERINWMSNLRDTISKLCGLSYHWSITQASSGMTLTESQQIIKEIDRLMHLVDLQLNPEKKSHKEIQTLVKSIRLYTSSKSLRQLEDTLDAIIQKTQQLLIFEWNEVKKEAKYGELIDTKEINWWLHK